MTNNTVLLLWDSFSVDMSTSQLPGGTVVKNLPAKAGDAGECGLDPWIGEIPGRRARKPTPVF